MVRQLLEDERMQDGLAKNDGRIGRPNRQHMGMELKEESLWWTSTYAKEMDEPMVILSGGQLWVVPFVRKCDLLGYRHERSGECVAGMTKTPKKGTDSWFKEAHLHRSTAISRTRKCQRMVRYDYQVASKWLCELVLVTTKMKKVNDWETVMMRNMFRLRKKEEEDCKTYRTRTSGLARKT